MASSLVLTLQVATLTFGGALLGLWLRRVLPVHHVNEESRDVVRISIGLILTMTGLILGLVVSSAKSTFDNANLAVQQSGTDVLTLDRALKLYGNETLDIRRSIHQVLSDRVAENWPEMEPVAQPKSYERIDVSLERILVQILALKPATDSQRWLQSEALDLITDQEQKVWLRMERQGDSTGQPFSVALTAWLVVIFVSFGLFAPRHATGVVTLFICSASVAAAMFLIIELEHPYGGVLKVSPEPLQFALAQFGK